MVSKEINTNRYSRNIQYRTTLWCTVFQLANLVVCSIMHERASSVTQIAGHQAVCERGRASIRLENTQAFS